MKQRYQPGSWGDGEIWPSFLVLAEAGIVITALVKEEELATETKIATNIFD